MTSEVYPYNLTSILDLVPNAKVLSLDCFDTLLWRDTHAPQGLFGALPELTIAQRVVAEKRARKTARTARGSSEVSIEEIYTQAFPNAARNQRDDAIAAELAAEAVHCFGYQPVIDLMRLAKARKMQVVIVSDTYLNARQLETLIADAAGRETADLIDSIYCSSQFGLSKAQGMFANILQKLNVNPAQVLHIGDNKVADYEGAKRFGIAAYHFIQFSADTVQQSRLEAQIMAMVGQSQGHVIAPQPQRASLSAVGQTITNPAERLGFQTLGPVFYAFEQWLSREAEVLQENHGGAVHRLFLMRDGHLPLSVHRAINQTNSGHAVEISRFTATAASLDSAKNIESYVNQEMGLNPSTLARQLLFDEAEIESLIDDHDLEASCIELFRETRTGTRKKRIMRSSRQFADRLVEHVRKMVNPAPGDTLMLIDLGYNGSVQNRIHSLLEKRLKVRVVGRYFLLRELDRPGHDKQGMISSAQYDIQLLEALCANVAVLEQLCTTSMGSVVDYDPDGEPIRRKHDIKSSQSGLRDLVQSGCLHFAQIADSAVQTRPHGPDILSLWAPAATAALGRLMYLPQATELSVLAEFEHDVNLGSNRRVALFEPATAAKGLKKRGLFYSKGSSRMYLPAELSGQGLGTRLSYFAQKRFGLGFKFADFTDEILNIPVVYAKGDKVVTKILQASATHDGYFCLAIPIGANEYSVAVQFGAICEWLQIEPVTASAVDNYLADEDKARAAESEVSAEFDAIRRLAPSLYHCESQHGFMMVHPAAQQSANPIMIAAVFRPIVLRRSGTGQCAAPAPAIYESPQRQTIEATNAQL